MFLSVGVDVNNGNNLTLIQYNLLFRFAIVDRNTRLISLHVSFLTELRTQNEVY